MKLKELAAVVGFALCAPLIAVAYQDPPRPASLEGIVTRAGAGVPLPGARVTLLGPTKATARMPSPLDGLPPEYSWVYDLQAFGQSVVDSLWASQGHPAGSVTDQEGRFSFGGLSPGPYSLTVQANGHVIQSHAVTLTEGEARTGIAVILTPAANISGRLLDSFKQPLPNVPVELLHPVYDWNGQRTLEIVKETRTDDRGEYRIHWVTPGRYYLRAGHQANERFLLSDTIDRLRNGGIENLSINPNEVPADAGVAFYPGSPDLSGARAIDIGPGDELSSIDWTAPPAPATHTVRGRVIDSKTGKPPAYVDILAIRTNTGLPLEDEPDDLEADKPRYEPSTGRVEIHNLTPGVYQIVAVIAREGASGFMTVTIAERDVDGINITLVPAVLVSGRFRIEGDPPPPPPSRPGEPKGAVTRFPFSVTLQPVRTDVVPAISTQHGEGPVTQDAFQLRASPGAYRVSVFGLPPGGYLKEARLDGADVLNSPLLLSGSATLDIVVSMHGGEIRGTIVDGRGAAAPRAHVVLVPDRGRQRVDLYRNAFTEPDGSFTMQGVAPGDYKLFSWETVERYQWFDPEFIAQFESKGAPVHVSESSMEHAQVKWIPSGGAQ